MAIQRGDPIKADDINNAFATKQNKITGGTANNIVAYSGTAGTLNTLDRVTSVRAAAAALDTAIPTEKAVASGLAAKANSSDMTTALAAKINTADAQSKIAAGTANNIVAYSGTAGTLNTLDRVTGVRAAASALDTAIPTEKAVSTALDAKANSSDMTTALAAKANAADVQARLPVGTILMFDGTDWQDNVTLVGWYKCDGANGTPDLRDKFIKGTGSLPSTGGSNALTAAMLPKHTHTIYTSATKNTARTADKSLTGSFPSMYRLVTSDSHSQIVSISETSAGDADGWEGRQPMHKALIDATHNHTGGANNDNSSVGDSNASNMPLYYALIYIRRCA
jgi:hypothetical protein